jgi:hypothetical protein
LHRISPHPKDKKPSSDGNLYALDLETGNEYSHISIEASSQSLPGFSNGKIIYANGGQILLISSE